jgi:hypothetical protein
MAATNIQYRFIDNVGDYFPSGYFGEDFIDKVQRAAGLSTTEMDEMCPPYVALKAEYEKYKNYIVNANPRVKDAIKHTHDFHTLLLRTLGYDASHPYDRFICVNDDATSVVPVRHVLSHGKCTSMFVMEMQHLIKTGDNEPAGLFQQHYNVTDSLGRSEDQTIRHQQFYAGQWSEVFQIPAEQTISPAVINKAVDAIFLLPEEQRPHYILMLAGNTVFLLDAEKWNRGAYLQFSLDELFSQASVKAFRRYYALFHLLCGKEALASDSDTVLMDTLREDSFKNAYEVTKDLKEGVVLAVETLANEALYWWKQHHTIPVDDYTDDAFEGRVKDDCLTIVYRLLFIFYAESRTELEILPLSDEVYRDGYSLEMLRDLEQTRLNSQESRDGYFFHETISHLFSLLSSGYHESAGVLNSKSFAIRHIDSPMFDNSKLHHLADVKIRNAKWQEIIRALSLSKKNSRTGRGRISYANLGVNQLGSVYESLLAYRGFYAEEDYIEVHKADTPEDGTFLVPYSRMDDFEANEILTDENGNPVILPKGTFVYRLNGRDRQKSASYYTPEILTRSTVKYTLKGFIDEVAAGTRKASDLLDLKILEPAMGAAAFQNEVVNQLAEAYLTYQQQQRRDAGLKEWRISPDRYRDELQKVKAYIATHNVYGVDLNPTAIELGKLALWLNVIHKDMETPFFANRLSVGNAVIGAWLKTYNKEEVLGIPARGQKLAPNPWWEKSPKKIKFYQNRVNRSVNEVYHFLLPDKSMLGVRTIKEQKQANTEADKAMKNCADGWIAPISQTDFRTLQRISGKIDVLLKEYFTDQLSIDKYTRNKGDVWGLRDNSESGSLFANAERVENYANKQRLFDTRYRHDNAYHKLKLVMDYWCALWFWEYKDASSLPTREQYWADIEAMLDVDNDKLDTKTRQAMERHGMNDLFDNVDLEDEGRTLTEEESAILVRSKRELLLGTKGQGQTLNLFEEPERFKIVQRLSDRYHFFHPMLEFIEVFWLRDGFDVICGNPPWIKLEFNEANVISDRYPEVAIRRVSAPEVRSRIKDFMSNDAMKALYEGEQNEQACSTVFLNAVCNYPLLVGQQTNLYKCVLTNCMEMMSPSGYAGILCPESIYDDPKGQPLRRELYKRLRYHFQYQNELRLFAEVHHHTVYGDQLLGPRRSSSPRFASLSNLFHPNTVDACFAHDGSGLCGGIKDEKGNWNTSAHKDRIVYFGERELRILSETFEDGADWESVKLNNIHASEIVKVLDALSNFPTHIRNFNTIISEGLHETNAVDKGIIKRNTSIPDWGKSQMIFSGPHFYVGNPVYKNPRLNCSLNSDYDNIDLLSIDENYTARTNYTPIISNESYINLIKGFVIRQNCNGEDVYDKWIDHYKVAFRLMTGGGSGERTLTSAILPPNSSHLVTAISTIFNNNNLVVEFAGLSASIIQDFFIKIIGCGAIHATRVESFPLGVAPKYQSALYSRTLLLNCLTKHYADLWEECWRDEYAKEQWSITDSRLKPFNGLERKWSWNTPLRNYFERRQALVEIDVIAAMALGLSLKDLELIYRIQFPVLQQNENDTWYDTKGNIVFTCSRGLTGVGVDRPVWNTIRDMKSGETYVHTIEKSELYKGQQVTYYAPFTRCDRIEDYRRAWAHFEPIFNK